MKLIDRVAAGIDQLGKRAAQALDESKLRMEQAGVRRRRDHAARELGYLAYRRSKGETVADAESEVLIRRMAAADEEIAKLECIRACSRTTSVSTSWGIRRSWCKTCRRRGVWWRQISCTEWPSPTV